MSETQRNEKDVAQCLKDCFISKQNILGWLRTMVGQGINVLVPVMSDGKVAYEPLSTMKDENVLLDFSNSYRPPKGIVFPQSEVLLVYDTEKPTKGQKKAKPRYRVQEVRPDMNDTVIFAIRPCDAHGVAILDKVFGGPLTDQYYSQRRSKLTLIGLACSQPELNCFCTSVGGSPSGTDGLDILLTAITGGYHVMAMTKKGAAMLDGPSFKDSTEDQHGQALKAQQKAVEGFAREMKEGPVDPNAMVDALKGMYEDRLWDDIARKCIGCGACTYLCPTCHCFDINDEGNARKGRRVRTWDTCQFPDFTLHTSGHNPRPQKKFRIRQRIYHKFKYMPENIGMIGCVGCGRCITVCPMNMDLFRILLDVRTAGKKAPVKEAGR